MIATVQGMQPLTRLQSHAVSQYWRKCQIEELFDLPFLDLVFQAAQVHRQHFNPQQIQLSTLLSIKTGGCPEDCEYCPQSAHYSTGVEKQQILDVGEIVAKAKIAQSPLAAEAMKNGAKLRIAVVTNSTYDGLCYNAESIAKKIGNAVDFWTEASLFSLAGLTALVYGPGDIAQAHTADEFVALEQLQRYTDTITRILGNQNT